MSPPVHAVCVLIAALACTLSAISALAGCTLHGTSSPGVGRVATATVSSSTATAAVVLYRGSLYVETPEWPNSETCNFTDQGLFVTPVSGKASSCVAPTPAVADVAVTVSVRQWTGSTDQFFGVTLRQTGPADYLFVGIDGHGRFQITAVASGVRHDLVPALASSAIKTSDGASNQLRVIAKGQRLDLAVNGVAVKQLSLPEARQGQVGLRGVSDGIVAFWDLTVMRA